MLPHFAVGFGTKLKAVSALDLEYAFDPSLKYSPSHADGLYNEPDARSRSGHLLDFPVVSMPELTSCKMLLCKLLPQMAENMSISKMGTA